jgi:hypothetical protein
MLQKNFAQTSDVHREATEYAYREQWDSAIATTECLFVTKHSILTEECVIT